MDRDNRFATVLPVGVVVVGIGTHRTWAVERQHRGNVLEVVRNHGSQQRPHRPAVELENPKRVSSGEELVGGRVIKFELLGNDDPAVCLDRLQAVVDDREVPQTEEVPS